MAQDTDQLRAQLDRQRAEISDTVDQIENRVSPTHVIGRRRDKIARRLTDWKDTILGNDEPDYPPPRNRRRAPSPELTYSSSSHGTAGSEDTSASEQLSDIGENLRQRVESTAADASDAVQEAPAVVRRRTRGNPMAAGAVALGAGWLIGSLLPESRPERQAVRRVEPQLSDAASTVKQEGRQLADELEEPAQRAVDEVKATGRQAAAELKDHSATAAENIREQAGS